jgi:hypothetical protein
MVLDFMFKDIFGVKEYITIFSSILELCPNVAKFKNRAVMVAIVTLRVIIILFILFIVKY